MQALLDKLQTAVENLAVDGDVPWDVKGGSTTGARGLACGVPWLEDVKRRKLVSRRALRIPPRIVKPLEDKEAVDQR